VPARKLTYQVDVDTSGAVGDLDRLGTAGARAGKDIADGFDQAESKSTSALKALSAQLDQTAADAKGLKAAVEAIKSNLTVDVDDSKIAGFASDLKNKMGLAFDEVTADAKAFADVLERGVDLSRTTSEIRGVDTALEGVHDHGDQSRSVLANLAGNAAQDLGELGGVVGSLGVGLGQLAEYAVDGNIKLGDLAGVAGPMLGLTAALALVQGAQAEIAAQDAFDTAQVDAYASAIDDVGPGLEAVQQRLQDISDAVPADDKANSLTNLLRTGQALLGNLGELANPIASISGHITNYAEVLGNLGFTYEDLADVIAGGKPARDDFEEHLKRIPEAEGLTENIMSFITQQQDAYAEALGISTDQLDEYTAATNKGTGENKFYASSLQSINDALAAQRIDENPLSVLSDGIAELNGQQYDLQALWGTVVQDLKDGKADYAGTAAYVDVLAEAFHMTTDEVVALARETGEAGKSNADYQASTKSVTDASQAQADALQAQADATQALIDKQHDMLDATDDLADAQQAWDDGLAEFPQTVAESTAAMDEATAGSPEWIQARNDQRDALESLVEQYVRTTELQAQANGQQLTAAQRVGAQATALGKLAGTLDSSTIPAVAAYYSQLFKIPESKRTEFEMILASGDQGEIERFVTENSGTKSLAVQVMTNEANLATQEEKIKGVAAPRTADIYTEAHTVTAKGQIAAAFPPVTIPVGADVSSAKSTASQFRREQENNPVYIKVRATTSGTSSGGGGSYSKSAEPSATATSSAVPVSVSGDVWSPAMAAPRPINVNVAVSAGVIGSRADVRRAVLDAMAEAERLGRVPA
jgi:hypothetical protein